MDRVEECAEIDRLLEAVRGGLSGTLVLRGDAGVGKSSILDRAVETGSDLLLARVVGVESEVDLGFAGCTSCWCRFSGSSRGCHPLSVTRWGLRSASNRDHLRIGSW